MYTLGEEMLEDKYSFNLSYGWIATGRLDLGDRADDD